MLIYHVCAERYLPPDLKQLFDGLVIRERPIMNYDDYVTLKQEVNEYFPKGGPPALMNVIITSLTLIYVAPPAEPAPDKPTE